ncbi:MAG: acylneuraminate cytidylyltransferase family protein [Bacteroidetes bacterium HGW-Bacteroidetes-13]|nr:MAG: acylneuraminate cytidylyltransferase family protein [Bacteroidetes bacterium HGW-Bacteroidetes-13]
MPKIIAVIPARGGSKRIPGKNMQLLDGIPLFVHSISYAQQFPDLIDEIYVSTDDETIRSKAIEAGAKVIDRPALLATDTATSASVLAHALTQIPEKVDWVVLLQPTNPLRPQGLMENAFEILKNGQYNSLMTVTENRQKFGKIKNGKLAPFNYTYGQRSQDIEPLYFENGLLYITSAALIRQGRIVGDKLFPLIVNHPFAQVDIDEPDDLLLAEFYLKKFL